MFYNNYYDILLNLWWLLKLSLEREVVLMLCELLMLFYFFLNMHTRIVSVDRYIKNEFFLKYLSYISNLNIDN